MAHGRDVPSGTSGCVRRAVFVQSQSDRAYEVETTEEERLGKDSEGSKIWKQFL